ncbi:MAG: flagellar motor protein MotB [Alphaproteobacteria bacterium]
MADAPIIIIRRKKKGGEAAHHGGAWKVAYADFVTAMMAFFLLLWLLNVTTDEQRHGIADYFTPASIARSESGAGGMMGGQTITAPGAMISQNTPPTFDERTIPSVGQGEQGDEDTVGGSDHGGGKDDKIGGGAGKKKTPGAEEAARAKQEAIDNARFQEAEQELKSAIKGNALLSEFADQIMIDHTPEGLRIQIVDKDNYSMFPSGSTILYEKSRQLLGLIGRVLARLPNEVSIAGHTDGTPFPTGSRRDNWTLSAERANVSRQELMDAGVAGSRIARVIGMADRDAMDKSDPKSPKNRRISITLLRKNLSADAAPPMLAPSAAPPSPSLGAPPTAPGATMMPSVMRDRQE